MSTDRPPIARTHLAGRAVRIVLGDDVVPGLWPILVITLMSTTTFAGVWGYAGIWAVTSLHASAGAVGAMFLVYAFGSAVTGWAGGALSDRLGRKRVMLGGWLVASMLILCLAVADGNAALQMCLVVLAMAAGSPASAASSAVAADLVTPDNRERAYASIRVMFNLGSVLGPPLAGLLLLGENWSLLFLVFGVLGLTTAVIVLLLPLAAVDQASGDTLSPGRGRVLADRAFLLLLASTFVGYFSYVSFSSVLPVAAVSDYQLPASLWGFIFAINPIAVVLFQLRTTQATRTIGSGPKLIGSSLLMGLPFLVLLVLPNAVGVVLVTCIFVAGEMVWVPVVQGMVVTVAPPKQRGRYLGAYRSVGQMAMGLAPFVLLNLRGLGQQWAWVLVAAICVFGAALGMVAVRMSRAASHEP